MEFTEAESNINDMICEYTFHGCGGYPGNYGEEEEEEEME